MSKWGNPILQGIIDGFEKQRVMAQRETTRTASRRPQSGGRDPQAHRTLSRALGGGAQVTPQMGLDEMFLRAVQAQQLDAQQRGASAQAREEAAHPEFYKGRRTNALPW